jgi:hypothetical protein
VLILAFIGVAYTSFSKAPMTLYWMILTPFIGLICVVTRWGDAESQEQRLRLIRTQAVHWGAVFVAMRLMFLTDVSRMMNANASALSAMTLLALRDIHSWLAYSGMEYLPDRNHARHRGPCDFMNSLRYFFF